MDSIIAKEFNNRKSSASNIIRNIPFLEKVESDGSSVGFLRTIE